MISHGKDLECPVCAAVGRHRCPGGLYLRFSAGELVPVQLPAEVVTPWPHMVPLGTPPERARAVFRERLIRACPF